jgi:hypothetical protein
MTIFSYRFNKYFFVTGRTLSGFALATEARGFSPALVGSGLVGWLVDGGWFSF